MQLLCVLSGDQSVIVGSEMRRGRRYRNAGGPETRKRLDELC